MGTEDTPGPAPAKSPRPAIPARRRGAQQAASARRRRKVYVVVAAMLILAQLILAWVLLLHPYRDPEFLTVSLTEYDDPRIPVNAFGKQDSELLLVPFSAPSGPKPTRAFGSQTRESLLREIEGRRDVADRPVVVHLSARAWADADEVYLLPGEARLGDPAAALTLSELLSALQKCGAPHKLLLLDVMRPLADPFAGVLVDDVAERVQAVVEKLDDPKLLVLAACSAGQSSLTSEELGHSVFAYYAELGLRGWADGYGSAKPDGRVTARELADFVRDRLDRWATLNAGTRQTPILLGKDDFDLAARDRSKAQPAEDLPDPPAYPEWLVAVWQQRDEWADGGAGQFLPRGLRQLEAKLLRAERRWRGGVAEAAVNEDVGRAANDFKARLEQARKSVPQPAEPRSLALLARLRHFKPDPAVRDAVHDLLTNLDAPPPTEEKARQQWAKTAEDQVKKYKEKFKDTPAEFAGALVEGLAEESNLRADKVAFVNDLMRALALPPFVETEFLRRLGEPPDNPAWGGDKLDAVRRAFRVTRAAEAAANADPRALPAVAADLRAAAEKRRQGVELLFSGKKSKLPDAISLLTEADQWLQKVLPLQEALIAAHDTHDQALALLPEYVPYLAGLPEDQRRQEGDWRQAVQLTRDLRGLLDRSPAAAPDELHTARRNLQEVLDRLRQPFDTKSVDELVKASRQPEATVALVGAMNLLLETTLLKAADRGKLWAARRDLARLLHLETARRDRADDQQLKAVSSEKDREDRRQAERKRALRRAALAADLLSLEDWPAGEPAGLAAALGDVREDRGGRAAFDALGRALRRAWVEQLPGRVSARPEGKALLAADRISRILLPTGGRQADPAAPGPEPTLLLRRSQAEALWRWLAESYQADAGPGAAGAFYRKAAEDYLLGLP
jgi:hypothetical protein